MDTPALSKAAVSNQATTPPMASERYSWFVLITLMIVYVLNFVDRQILSILAEDVKRDLGLTDADLGFLYGTAFGVFYALFGIPLGRLADSWNRVRLITIGLSLWSTMTALSGFSRTGGELAAARVGVGIGEATASPCAYSLISDYFPKEKRATALAVYSSGLFVGGGLSLFIGGAIVQNWNHAFPGGGPMGLVGWQAAFLAVGIPGLLVALLVSTIKEPVRGQADGLITPVDPHPFKGFAQELMTVIPPFTLIGASKRGASALAINLAVALIIAGAAWQLIRLTGDLPQWTAMGIGIYAVFSWTTALSVRDKPAYALIWGTPCFIAIVIGYSLISFVSYASNFWAAPYAIRELGATTAQAGLILGSMGALGGFLGVILGGRLADKLRQTNKAGRILVIMFGLIAPIPFIAIAFTTDSLTLFYIMQFPANVFAASALGASAASTQDLVLPRMRGAATATFFLGTTLIGLALGPYLAGKISTVTGSLATGNLALLATAPISIICLLYAYRALPKMEETLVERAQAAGEAI